MRIRVRGYFTLQKAMDGKSLVEVEKASATLGELLQDLTHRFGRALAEQIYDSDKDEPAGQLILLVNGRNYLTLPDRLDTRLKEGDEIALFPPLAGG